jgi:hypothetical protein
LTSGDVVLVHIGIATLEGKRDAFAHYTHTVHGVHEGMLLGIEDISLDD